MPSRERFIALGLGVVIVQAAFLPGVPPGHRVLPGILGAAAVGSGR